MAIIHTTLIILLVILHVVTSFTLPSSSLARQYNNNKQSTYCKPSTTALHGLFDNDTDASDKPSEIPPELRDEIFAAEANTPAAQGRQQRIITYIILTLLGVTTAFFNAFLSDLRFGDGAPSEDLAYYGFDWVANNVLLNFAFTNKIGGALGLLGAGLSGTLAEVEVSLYVMCALCVLLCIRCVHMMCTFSTFYLLLNYTLHTIYYTDTIQERECRKDMARNRTTTNNKR